MKTVKNGKVVEKNVKKSKFISKAFNVEDAEDVLEILDLMKESYPDSTHIVYGLVIGSFEKCSDDGEPSGTAGKPILNLIKKQNLDNVLIVVVRYFGGIKLGTGGLVKSYTESAKFALENAEIVEMTLKVNVNTHISYDKAFQIYLLSNSGLFSIKNRIGNDFVLECDVENEIRVVESLDLLGCSEIETYKVLV